MPTRTLSSENAAEGAHLFWPKFTESETGCWIWRAARVNVYGKFAFGPKRAVVQCLAHRYSYTLLVGDIAPGLDIDHLCRNTLCVNPDHLQPVTRAENIRRSRPYRTHCASGHLFDVRYLRGGHIACKPCDRAAIARWRERQDHRAA